MKQRNNFGVKMNTRLGNKTDLPQLESMYNQIVKVMNNNGIHIWNNYYPFEEFEGDIDGKRLHLTLDNNTIVAAYAVFESIKGFENFKWDDVNAKAIYIGRLGVNVDYLRQGMGSKILSQAHDFAKNVGCEYLRLTVVEDNLPAIKLYLKNGYKQVVGTYDEFSESLNKTIHEVGFELKIK